jgi:hypothetical protein
VLGPQAAAELDDLAIAKVFGRYPISGHRQFRKFGSVLLQVDGLVMPGVVEQCTPHLVHALMI